MSMDICSQIGLSTSDNSPKFAHEVDELGDNVAKFLHIQDARETELISSSPPKSCEFQNKDVCKITTQASENCVCKLPTFPSSGEALSSQDAVVGELLMPDDNVASCDPSGFCSTSFPTHLKAVSAMKGSRESRGATPPAKLTVKWAPDVYDPIPTSVSHVVTHNRSSRHSKKSSKNKQKHATKSTTRGSKGKDKKPVRKRGGNSSGIGYKLADYEEDLVDFHVGKPDQLCGSSFMKRYGTNLHLSSLAEAT